LITSYCLSQNRHRLKACATSDCDFSSAVAEGFHVPSANYFGLIGAEAKTEDNDIIDEMQSAAKDMVSATEDDSPLRDAALIVAGNQVEHYEIAMYGSLVSFARQLGLREAAGLLEQSLNEEKAADAKLTQIGETAVNPQATQMPRAA